MAGNPPKLKLKLKKTETNRLKTDTGRHKTESDGDSADPSIQPTIMKDVGSTMPAADPGSTVEISDPMARRETSSGKLKRIPAADTAASETGITPAGPPQGRTTETVRLKIVREKKPDLQAMMKDGGNGVSPGQTAAVAPPVADAPTIVSASAPTIVPGGGGPKISLPESGQRGKIQLGVKGEAPGGGAGGTVRVAPPTGAEKPPADGPLRTSTSTVKLPTAAGGRSPAASGINLTDDATIAPQASRNATATLKIKPTRGAPPPAVAAPVPDSAVDDMAKTIASGGHREATATLKVMPVAATPVAGPPEAEETVAPMASSGGASRNATATLKIRPSKPGAPKISATGDAGATVKIKPPAAKLAAVKPAAGGVDDAAATRMSVPLPAAGGVEEPTAASAAIGSRLSLKLRKKAAGEAGEKTESLPDVGEAVPEAASADDASATIAMAPPAAEVEDDDAQATVAIAAPKADPAEKKKKKKGLSLRTKKAGDEADEDDDAPEAEAAAESKPKKAKKKLPPSVGEGEPVGIIVVAGSAIAAIAAAVAVVRIALDLVPFL